MSLLLCFQTVDHRLISSKSLVACIVPTTRSSLPKRMHIWELFNEYYGMKVSHISTNKSRTDLDFLSQTFIRITNKLLETCISSCLFKLPNRVILWTNLQCSDSYLISLTSMGLVLLYSNHRRKPKRDLFSFVSWACARYIFTCYICFLFKHVLPWEWTIVGLRWNVSLTLINEWWLYLLDKNICICCCRSIWISHHSDWSMITYISNPTRTKNIWPYETLFPGASSFRDIPCT